MTKELERELNRYQSNWLTNVQLVFPAKDLKSAGSFVTIKRCQIKRLAKNLQTKKFECALEFKEIRDVERKILTNLFYEWQRDYLRRRRLMKA